MKRLIKVPCPTCLAKLKTEHKRNPKNCERDDIPTVIDGEECDSCYRESLGVSSIYCPTFNEAFWHLNL